MEDTKLNITEKSDDEQLTARAYGAYGNGTFPCNNGTDRLWYLPTRERAAL